MANNQNVNKVVYGSNTLIDLTDDDVTENDVLSGKKFHLPSGAQGMGVLSVVSPTIVISDIIGGHRVTITDKEHPQGQSFDVMDGVDGDPASAEAIVSAVEEWLNEHITQETGYALDDTLTVSGAAADAKKTGDELSDLKSAIAGIETGTTVSKAYTYGQLLIANGTLYKVIAPDGIASGGTLTPGTNVQGTTIDDEFANTRSIIDSLETAGSELGILQPLSVLSMTDYGIDESKGFTGRRVTKTGNKFKTTQNSASTSYRYIRLFGGLTSVSNDDYGNIGITYENSLAIPTLSGCDVYAVFKYAHISGNGNASILFYTETDTDGISVRKTAVNGIADNGIAMVKLDPAKRFNAVLYSKNSAKVDTFEISLVAFPAMT